MLLLYFIIFILGLIIGSFLNVVIFRLENGGKIINDRSRCLHCRHILNWYDLIPILSFIFLKGKCRYCKRSISIQYPLVELLTGIVFILIFNFSAQGGPVLGWQFYLSIFYYFYISSVFIVIFVYDLKHYIIPDKIIYPAIIIATGFNLFNNIQYSIFNIQSIFNFLFPAILASGFFYAIIIITKGKGMGGGDVKLAFLMGLLLGWPIILLSLFLSFIFGSIVGICLILIGRKKMSSKIPFGPFLIIGTFIGLFKGEEIIRWYLNIIN